MDVKELDDMCDKLAEFKVCKAVVEKTLKSLNKEIISLEFNIKGVLEDHNKTTYSTNKIKIDLKEEVSYNFYDEEKLYDYMKDLGSFHKLAKINKGTLKKEVRLMIEDKREGDPSDDLWVPPGVSEEIKTLPKTKLL